MCTDILEAVSALPTAEVRMVKPVIGHIPTTNSVADISLHFIMPQHRLTCDKRKRRVGDVSSTSTRRKQGAKTASLHI